MTELRTEPPDAGAARIALIAGRYHRIARGGAAGFTESRRSNHAFRPKTNPDIWLFEAVDKTIGPVKIALSPIC